MKKRGGTALGNYEQMLDYLRASNNNKLANDAEHAYVRMVVYIQGISTLLLVTVGLVRWRFDLNAEHWPISVILIRGERCGGGKSKPYSNPKLRPKQSED